MPFKTADLYDQYENVLQVAEPLFADFGGKDRFFGPAETVKCFEDNSRVKELLNSPGNGRVLVVDGGSSIRCALLGDMIAESAVKQGWAGVIINGCVRDVEDMAGMDLGVKALASTPRKSVRRGEGQTGLPVTFAGVTVTPGDWVYADADGIIVSAQELSLD